MRFVASAAFVTAALVVNASAFAAEPAPAPAATPSPAPAALSPASAASSPAAASPAAAPPPYYGPAYPGYPAPYAVYGAPGGGAPSPYWMAAPPVTERRSNGMRIAGIALFGVGGAISVVGGVIFGAVGTRGCIEDVVGDDGGGVPPAGPKAVHERVGSARQKLDACDVSPELGIGLLAGGLVTALVGIPLFVIGSQNVPLQRMNESRNLLPTLSIGTHNASLRWSF